MMTTNDKRPIGVFDSGVGGLTVYRALRAALPFEDFIYLGDTARLPYGTKSPETVTGYAAQAGRLLMQHDVKLLVIACNTASALALPHLSDELSLPCLGVIAPGAVSALDAVAQLREPRIAVLATESTVRSGAYADAIALRNPSAQVRMLACNLLVSLAEEGWCDGVEADIIVARYLRELGHDFDALVLGCTHFPLLSDILRAQVPPTVPLIDSGVAAAREVAAYLVTHDMANLQNTLGRDQFMVTDSPERFGRLAARFLQTKSNITANLVHLTPPVSGSDAGTIVRVA